MTGKAFFDELAASPVITRVHPKIGAFFREYLLGEKAIDFNGRKVVNTHIPPYPSKAFFGMMDRINETNGKQRLYSVTIAVSNRCNFRCWHCYNAGRDQHDMDLPTLQKCAHQLQELGAVTITLSGGEPLLRNDLVEICRSFDDRSYLKLNTTGWGLTLEKATSLRQAGLFAVGISLDSAIEEEHDRLRGRQGAYQAALRAIAICREASLYPYIIGVATRQFLDAGHFNAYVELAAKSGALEIHLLEPCPVGKLTGQTNVALGASEKSAIIEYQHKIAQREDLPILSSLTYLEGRNAFGCGAGLTHLYIDGSGELCPCNLMPMSFGNITKDSVESILRQMGQYFKKPRPSCVGQLLRNNIPAKQPTSPEISREICEKYLPKEHDLPFFFRAQQEGNSKAGNEELSKAYDRVHGDYNQFWVSQAGKPVKRLINKLGLHGCKAIYEAGCGSGFATEFLSSELHAGGKIVAVDLSEGMLAEARQRCAKVSTNIEFIQGDALEKMPIDGRMDCIFTSWVLGYIPLKPFFQKALQAVKNTGRLALIVHKENSPKREMELFTKLVAKNPQALTRQVHFDFPQSIDDLKEIMTQCQWQPLTLWEGKVIFRYETANAVLEHLLKSGAGTVFHDAIDPQYRAALIQEFLSELRRGHRQKFRVIHDYIACIATPLFKALTA